MCNLLFNTFRFLTLILMFKIDLTLANFELDLYRDIQSNLSRHDKYLRPVINATTALQLNLSIFVNNLLDVDEKGQVLSVKMFLSMLWMNEYVSWNPADYGGLDLIFLPINEVWHPVMDLYTRVEDVSTGDTKFSDVSIYPNGSSVLMNSMTFKAGCNLNMVNYPFDKHSCSFRLAQWIYRYEHLRYEVTIIPETEENTEFNITSIHSVIERGMGNDGKIFNEVNLMISFERYSPFIVNMIFVPMGLLFVMSGMAFLLPPNSEAKAEIQLSAMLSFAVYSLLIGDQMPPSQTLPLAGWVLISVMVTILLSLFVSITTIQISTKSESRPPRCLYQICLWLSCSQCFTCNKKSNGSLIKVVPADEAKLDTDGKRNDLQTLFELLEEHKKSSDINKEWMLIGAVIDKIYFLGLLVMGIAVINWFYAAPGNL